MRFIRYFLFDLKQGVFHNKALLFTPAAIGALVFLDFFFKAHRYLAIGAIEESVSYGDYWFYLYGGMKEYTPGPDNAFSFPVVWMIVFAAVPFALVNYPFRDMGGIGQQILVRSRSRNIWWLSKCCWNFVGTVLYHLLLQAVGAALFLLFRMDLTYRIHMDFIRVVYDALHEELWERSALPLAMLVLPVLVSATVNMLQMTLSLFVRPMFGFFVAALLLLASAYLMSPVLAGNYAMAYRCDWMLKGGVTGRAGLTVAAALLVAALLLGLVRFHFYDILEE